MVEPPGTAACSWGGVLDPRRHHPHPPARPARGRSVRRDAPVRVRLGPVEPHRQGLLLALLARVARVPARTVARRACVLFGCRTIAPHLGRCRGPAATCGPDVDLTPPGNIAIMALLDTVELED